MKLLLILNIMERKYLLKVIEKHFFVLSKDEIAKQIVSETLELSYFIIDHLVKQSEKLDNAQEYQKIFHPLFCEAGLKIMKKINDMEKGNLSIFDREKLFDDCLLFISIYYHYSAVLYPIAMADFLRLVLTTKILLT